MAGINKVILVGNLGKDPEVQHLEGGITIAKFSLATTEAYKDKSGNRKEQTEWHNIIVWRGLADTAEKYLKKGMSIYLEGRIRYKSYEKEGVKHFNTEIVCDTFTMLGKKENTAPISTGETESKIATEHAPDKTEDGLPF